MQTLPEGAFIATEVMDASEPSQHLCHKCGLLLSSNNYQVKMCQGNCRPRKVFHFNCIREKYHKMIKFCCQVCDNCNTEEGCYSCGGEISDLEIAHYIKFEDWLFAICPHSMSTWGNDILQLQTVYITYNMKC